jgi:hypothetical protein
VAMKNVVFWDIKSLFLPHIVSPLKIFGFHSIDHEECRLLGSYAVWLLLEPTFRRKFRLHHQGVVNLLATNNVSSIYETNYC